MYDDDSVTNWLAKEVMYVCIIIIVLIDRWSFNPHIYGTFFLTWSSNSDVLGPLAVKIILPCSAIIILGLHVDVNSGKFKLYIFYWSSKIISILF